jgi:pimeloyl-ACP methyl ester carboxylesterase
MTGTCAAEWHDRVRPPVRVGTVLLAAVLLVTGCSAAQGPVATASSGSGMHTRPTPSEPAEGRQVEGMYDVGGHQLFMRCEGSGRPTVVYLHGWIDEPRILPHVNGEYIAEQLPDHRICLYDRRNVGRSETVDAVQTPADVLHDLERVLEAGGVQPPYILVGASFGGLLAYSYLNHHPEDVAGMVLLDAMFPDELGLDRYLKPKDRFAAYAKADACCSLERIPQYSLVRDLQRYIGHEPAVPVTYLAAKREPRTVNEYDSPEYDKRVTPALQAYVDRFSPGRLVWVDSPHFMEPAVPAEVARAIQDVSRLAKTT